MGIHRTISLYTGAGGLDHGFEAAGLSPAVCVEMDPIAVASLTSRESELGWEVIKENIHQAPSDEILARAGLKQGEASVLVGGPPCQPFSKSAYWARGVTKRLDDHRASTLEAYLRVLRDAQPQAFVLENVPGLGYRAKDEGLQLLRRTVEDINSETGATYSFSSAVLNAADFGVPQERRRLFVVGHREGRDFSFPAPTHSRPDQDGSPLEPYHTAWDAIGDLPDNDDPALQPTGKWAELLKSIPEGSNYLHHTPRGEGEPLFGWRTRYWSFLLKLAKRSASWTITAQPGPATGPFHWKSRRLSAREMARLQTFPDSVAIQGSLRDAQRQLGNAVPSALAEVLANEVLVQFLDAAGPESGTTATLLPPRRTDLPGPEEVASVHPRYLSMAGNHAQHPGTGKGPGARRRGVA